MRRLSLLLLFLLVSYAGMSQCKTKKDPFSGEEVTTFYLKNRSLFTYNHTSKDVVLNLRVSYKGHLNEHMAKGSKIMFKLSDGTIMEFVSDKEIAPVSEVHDQIYTYYAFNIKLSEQELQKIAASKIAYMQKPDMKGGAVTIDIKKNGSNFWKFFNTGAKCIAKNIQP